MKLNIHTDREKLKWALQCETARLVNEKIGIHVHKNGKCPIAHKPGLDAEEILALKKQAARNLGIQLEGWLA